jgi:NAD(P)H-dependent FMN reductase
MDDNAFRLTVIVGSTREGRVGPTVARWFVDQVEQRGDMQVDVVDLAEVRLPSELSSQPGPALKTMEPAMAADAFVVVTPEYNHSYPASLKNAIDWHFTQWQAKPVGFVSYGGLAGGLRAVEHLRQVFAELHAVTVRDTVSFHGVWGQFTEEGALREPEAANAAAKTMVDQLLWWGRALTSARNERAHGA